jgi:FixJ family two-component response regulator
MVQADFTVFVVDDDRGVLKGLLGLLRAAGYTAQGFLSGRDFLLQHDKTVPGCMILDVAMPGLDGLQLHSELKAQGDNRPAIFLTGEGDVPTSVQAMRAGAVDFLMKPVNPDELFAAITRAVAQDLAARRASGELDAIKERLATLTCREAEVLAHVVAGRLNKQIAGDLGTAEKTVKAHRGRMMKKLGFRTVADLVRITERAGIQPWQRTMCAPPPFSLNEIAYGRSQAGKLEGRTRDIVSPAS